MTDPSTPASPDADGDGRPTGDRDPDALIRRAGLAVDPDQDQHFLVDDRVLDRIPGYLPEGTDTGHVLEIGGGAGALTDRLLALVGGDARESGDRGGSADSGEDGDRGTVTVVERNADYADFLREEFADAVAAGRLEVVTGDALAADLPEFTACVANLPYGASSEIAFRLFPAKRPMVLMFQREFAERMVAEPGTSEYGRLSVSAQHYADVEIAEHVPREAFSPPPAVQSAVVRCRPRDPDYEVADEAFFLDFVKALFTQRRKTVRNAIRNTAHISGLGEPEAVVEAADEELLRQRPGTLAPAAFAALAELAREHGDPDGAPE